MYRTFAAIALFSCSAAAIASPAKPNVLYFGNSFTMSYYPTDVPALVDAIARASGRETGIIHRRLQSGASLGNFVEATGNNALSHLATQTLPAGETWDFVVIQGQSIEANSATGNPTLFRNNAQTIYNTIAASNPDVKAVLFQTWARHPNAGGFYPTPFTSPASMQAEIRANYRAVFHSLNAATPGSARYAGVGDGFEALGFPASIYGNDFYHSNNRGELLVAFTLFGAMHGPITSHLATSGKLDALATSIGMTRSDVINMAEAADSVGAPRGDANLDWNVDFDDLLTLAQHYGNTNGQTWFNGDFTGDGTVGFDDLLALAQAYGTTAPMPAGFDGSFASDWVLAQSLVPEPTSLFFAAAALCGSTRRRRSID